MSLGGGWYSELILALVSGLMGALILLNKLRLVLLVLLPYVLKCPLVVLSLISAASNSGLGDGLFEGCLLVLFLALFVVMVLLTVSDSIIPFLMSVLADALTV